ncbi:MAG TPA: hemerythrin domain-containing protein [Burkholderiales bacterium]|nr:hemerythrin domain-containing protein [Burkholderiales bacterium]
MNSLLSKITPGATSQLRMDHSHVLTTFHQYEMDSSPRAKKALADTICMSLEIHAQIEEEIFYPAMRAADEQQVQKSYPEHAEMKRLIAQLRASEPGTAEFDGTFMQLMRDVIHHVADEETILFPDAERLLGAQRLGELGAEMTKRRLELSAPRAGELAMNTVRSMPASTMIMAAGALLAGTYIVSHTMRRQTWVR